MGAQVLRQRLRVVLPDRLLQPGSREDDVAGRPDPGTERQPVGPPRLAQRRREYPVLHAGERAVAAVRDVVDQRCPTIRQRTLEEALDQSPPDLGGGRCLVPGVDVGGELPGGEGVGPAAALVPGEEQEVHGYGSGNAGEGTTNDGGDRGRTAAAHEDCPSTKMPRGSVIDTSQCGRSTVSLILRSPATLHSA